MKKIAIIISLFVGLAAFGKPVVKSEERGLRLLAYRTYLILSPVVRAGEKAPDTPQYSRQIVAILENCGERPVTIPTCPKQGKAGGREGLGQRTTEFAFRVETFGDRKIVESPVVYQPVTLAPGESAMLPIQREMVRSREYESTVADYVSFSVPEELASRHGWWSGSLLAPIQEDSPQKLPERKAGSTPVPTSAPSASETHP